MKTLRNMTVAALVLFAGCATYNGGKIVEGTDIAVGMAIPQSGGTLQVDALNFLTGFRFLFADRSGVECHYTVTNSVSAFGVYESHTVKSISIALTPTVEEAEDEGDEQPGEAGQGEKN
jgi:hypothetical protein